MQSIGPGSSLAGRSDRVVINLFGNPTRIARLLGLDVELPDPDNVAPEYWQRIHGDGGYKRRIADKIADPWWEGDPDWALLKRVPWGEIWFDLEEGIKLFVAAADIVYALELIDALRTRGVEMSDEQGKSLVWATPTRFTEGSLDRFGAHMAAAGLVQGCNDTIWVLPPSRR